MTARERRLMSDYEQVKKDFAGHKNIIITPVGDIPPEKYHVTYFVNGIYLLPDGKIETLGRHEVDIILHADYPRYKPICKISTPIWHQISVMVKFVLVIYGVPVNRYQTLL